MDPEFKEWLEEHGCTTEITQEDDGSGYYVMYVRLRNQHEFEVTVNPYGATSEQDRQGGAEK